MKKTSPGFCRNTRKWGGILSQLLALGICFGLFAVPSQGQYVAPPPAPPPPPLLYVRLDGPAGVKITFFRSGEVPRTFDAPATVGLRPGYRYRLQVSGMPGIPHVALYPTLEVYASLMPPQRQQAADFPVTINFQEEDFVKVLAGSLVTKAVIMEHPESAFPVATKAERPLEINLPGSRDPRLDAQERGRLLLVLQLGQREMSREELASQSVPGTLLLPGERVLPPPRFPPFMPWTCYPLFDPILGPRDLTAEAKLHDGGDWGLPAGFGPGGKLRGLDPSDTVAEYADSQGRKRIAVSNRTCLYVPRFVVFSRESAPASQVARLGPEGTQSIQSREMMQARQPVLAQHQHQHLGSFQGRQRSSGTEGTQGTAITGKIAGTAFTSSLQETASVLGTCLPPLAQEGKDRPLKIIKWPDKQSALVGDLITFTIRFLNQGGQPITDIVVSDNLTPRFEYVAGSARSDRESVFTIQPNDAGSSILRWEFPGALQPGQSGMVTFQVRIR